MNKKTGINSSHTEQSPLLVDIQSIDLHLGGRLLIKDLTIQLAHGARIGLTGPSGCGKTTLLRSIAARSLDVHSTAQQFALTTSRVGYIPQSGGMLPWYSLIRNLKLFTDPDAGEGWFSTVLSMMELDLVGNSFPDQLSGGESQRARLACAIVARPALCCADEPLTEVGLQQKWRLLERWSVEMSKRNSGLVLVSHDVDTLAYLCDEVIVLGEYRGKGSSVTSRLLVNGTPHPRNPSLLSDNSTEAFRHQVIEKLYAGK